MSHERNTKDVKNQKKISIFYAWYLIVHLFLLRNVLLLIRSQCLDVNLQIHVVIG